MIISSTNELILNTFTVTSGSVSDGNIGNARNSNFSKSVSSTSTTFVFTVGACDNVDYIALHGVKLAKDTIVTVSGTGYSDTYTSTGFRNQNIVFYLPTRKDFTQLTISIAGIGEKVVSFVQAGSAVEVPWGTNSGQSLYYLGYNTKTRTSANENAGPSLRTQRKIAPKLKINIKNVLKSWARTDFQQILDLYENQGVLSLIDYQNDDRPDESVALFDLDSVNVKTHNATTSLVDISFNARVSV